jgi:hypothetical protein
MLRTSLVVAGVLGVSYLLGMLVLGPVLVDAAGLRHPTVQTVGNTINSKYSTHRAISATKTANSAPAASGEPEVQIIPISSVHKTEAPKPHKRKHKKHRKSGSDIEQIWSAKRHNSDEPDPGQMRRDEERDLGDGGGKHSGDEN